MTYVTPIGNCRFNVHSGQQYLKSGLFLYIWAAASLRNPKRQPPCLLFVVQLLCLINRFTRKIGAQFFEHIRIDLRQNNGGMHFAAG